MPYLRATLIATLTAFATFVSAASFQAWLFGSRLSRAVPTIETGSWATETGGYAVAGYISPLPAVLLALAVFLGVFAWVGRRPSREPRVPSSESRA